MKVEVVYGNVKQQWLLTVEVPEGATVADAIQKSGILSQCAELNLSTLEVGIFSQPVTLTTLVQENDRIEIYRALLIDPKEARRQRAGTK